MASVSTEVRRTLLGGKSGLIISSTDPKKSFFAQNRLVSFPATDQRRPGTPTVCAGAAAAAERPGHGPVGEGVLAAAGGGGVRPPRAAVPGVAGRPGPPRLPRLPGMAGVFFGGPEFALQSIFEARFGPYLSCMRKVKLRKPFADQQMQTRFVFLLFLKVFFYFDKNCCFFVGFGVFLLCFFFLANFWIFAVKIFDSEKFLILALISPETKNFLSFFCHFVIFW